MHGPKFFLSLYGGASHCAQEASNLGVDSVILDYAHNKQNDLCTPAVQKETFNAVSSNHVACVGIELVCASWSLARRAPLHSPMPSALRDSGKHLFGFPYLTGRDAIAVKAGNAQYRHAMKLITLCLKHDVRGYLENPQSSRLFKTPGIQKLLRTRQAFLVTCHFCQYGTQWRKATSFLIWGVEPRSVVLNTCSMCHNRCSASGKRHVQLSGLGGGKFKTAAVQVYPRRLAQHLMMQLLAAPSYRNVT